MFALRMLILCAPAVMPVRCGPAGTSAPPETPPSRQALQDAIRQAADADAQARHQARLRDIDRLRYESAEGELHARIETLRGLAIGLSLALMAGMVWLAVEIRRRRIVAAVLDHQTRFIEADADPSAEGALQSND